MIYMQGIIVAMERVECRATYPQQWFLWNIWLSIMCIYIICHYFVPNKHEPIAIKFSISRLTTIHQCRHIWSYITWKSKPFRIYTFLLYIFVIYYYYYLLGIFIRVIRKPHVTTVLKKKHTHTRNKK